MNRIELEERLIDFGVLIIKIAEVLPKTRVGNHLAGQLIRSTSPVLNYAEAQSAESRKDIIHKLKISLKELRETFTCLKFIERTVKFVEMELLHQAMIENNQLISIFVKSITTTQSNGMSKVVNQKP